MDSQMVPLGVLFRHPFFLSALSRGQKQYVSLHIFETLYTMILGQTDCVDIETPRYIPLTTSLRMYCIERHGVPQSSDTCMCSLRAGAKP